jgi:integrase
MSELLLDRAGRRRSPATMPGFHAGRPPRNKGLRYPADPPKVEEIIAVMRTAGDDAHGRRLRGLIVIRWRAGLRIQEALALVEADLDQRRGGLLVRRGKGGRRREVGMDAWGWAELQPWLELRVELPSGRWSASSPDRRVGASGPVPPPGLTYVTPRSRPAFAVASRPTSSATRTPSRWRAKACRWS